tara:strand:- start:283 stop:483 length:201 start_codon:yes stop_codon:yes gene_type:complete
MHVCHRWLCDWPLREFSPEAIQKALPLVRPDGYFDAIHASAEIIDKVFRVLLKVIVSVPFLLRLKR